MKNPVDGFHLDFVKAFNKVHHMRFVKVNTQGIISCFVRCGIEKYCACLKWHELETSKENVKKTLVETA